MNRLLSILTLGALMGLLAGCSSMSTSFDYDDDADFASFRTFAWMDKPASVPGDAAQAAVRNDLVERRISSAVQNELAARGITENTGNPDLLAVFHIGVEDKIQVSDYGYAYSPYSSYWGRGAVGRQLDVYEYQQGTLIIDLVDAASKKLVWRGSGTKVIGDKQLSPDELQARIDAIVNKIMASYPPQKR